MTGSPRSRCIDLSATALTLLAIAVFPAVLPAQAPGAKRNRASGRPRR